MVVDAEVWYWSQNGMRQKMQASQEAYITVRDVERLLEEAYRRGYEKATADAHIQRD